jgi:hypothetical protein
MRHPDRGRWYLAALLSIVLALLVAGGIAFATVAVPILIGGDTWMHMWPWVGIPLSGVLGLASLAFSMKYFPDAIYRLLGGGYE